VWPAALDEVWAFVRTHSLKAGRNVFVYRPFRDQLITLEAGVELFSPLPASDQVFSSQTPTGRAVTAEHRGSYDGIPLAHAAIRRHCDAAGLQLAGPSWEVYGHYPADQTPPLTEVFYLLAE
jgi:effector-binding domain-containing protein